MDNKGLIFIPDISGFTKFINDTEIEHSRHIIQELLEIIINANQTGLEISEIEGDAILFYKYGEAPELKSLYHQVEKMFCEFHRHLEAYEKRRLCQCNACKTAVDLTLKVITHYGEFTGYTVKNFNKLIGKDIILAHQLLKNDIDHHEYWLVTDNLFQKKNKGDLPEWINWNNSTKKTESGDILFQYAYLSTLKEQIEPLPEEDLEIKNKVAVISIKKDFDTDIHTLFQTAVNFDLRNMWMLNVKKIEDVSDKLPQVGTKHRCVLDKGSSESYTSHFSYHPDKIEYGETDVKKDNAISFTFEKIGTYKTRIHFELYLKNNPIMLLIFRLFMKKKYEKQFLDSLEKLQELVKNVQPAAMNVM